VRRDNPASNHDRCFAGDDAAIAVSARAADIMLTTPDREATEVDAADNH
jgi:hypothetical protein